MIAKQPLGLKPGRNGRAVRGAEAALFHGTENYERAWSSFARLGQPLRLRSGQAKGGCPYMGVVTMTC